MKKIVGLLVALICVLMCSVSCSSSSTPSSVVEKQMKAMKSESYDKIADLFYFETKEAAAEGKQMLTSVFAKVSEQNKAKDGIKSYKIISEEISEDGESAEVKVSITYGDGTTEEQEVDTVMHDGKWYLHFGK